jgi:peptide/nickel transport system substrate-binding protein
MHRSVRNLGVPAAAAALALLLTGCGSGSTAHPAKQAAPPPAGTTGINAQPASNVKQGGTLRLSIEEWISQYNYYETDGTDGDGASILGQVEPDLFLLDSKGVPHPDPDYLVSAAVTSTSPQVVTYTLNPKAKWSDGKPLSYLDFKQLWLDTNGSNPAYLLSGSTGYNQISSVVQGADPTQVKVTFSKPYADWQNLFTPLLPADQIDTPAKFNKGWIEKIPVTAGAFKIGSMDKTTQTVTVVPDPNWWGPKPKLDSVVYRALDADAITDAFLNNEVDEAPAEDPANYARLSKSTSASIRTGSRWDEVHLTLNGARGPLQDVAVRQAVGEALNRQALADAFGKDLPVKLAPLDNHFFMPNQKGYKNNAGVYGVYDPTAAGKLLDGAGWKDNGAGKPRTKDGKELDLAYVVDAGSSQSAFDQAELVQSMLGQVGIKVTIQKVPDNDYFEKYVNDGNFDLTSFRFTDAVFTSQQASVYQQPQGANVFQNYGRIGSPEIDALLLQAGASTDPAQAEALYNQADAQIWKLGHSIELFQRPQIVAERKGLATSRHGPCGGASYGDAPRGGASRGGRRYDTCGRCPRSWRGGRWLAPGSVGAGSVATSCSARASWAAVSGRRGGREARRSNWKAEVRSPKVRRRQSVTLAAFTPVKRSRNCSTEVWSKASEATQPPTVQGDMTMQGTRKPPPTGRPPTNSPAVPALGKGGGTWSNRPSFSS